MRASQSLFKEPSLSISIRDLDHQKKDFTNAEDFQIEETEPESDMNRLHNSLYMSFSNQKRQALPNDDTSSIIYNS